ncbi:hypothetical protein NQ038_06925 [Brevibacterium sp. 50QC2O2]|uniref:hypothetical protein n=1 Tax=Brevibacterium TaxID=1696 RepID=UPI00211C5739|nr:MULTISPECIES: hypothetical protein [unclassified Brevibacterium]MCQ9366993.1 hypothetical protein [Brevibacterium sp. 91QC2O2]MCQ9384142.1 hypothetical protein [Brevibacterium sp. 68QC2CO]MCQ9388380.1 hypothetical protein [Brevibacterium sp. 50QC2O2]
MSQFETELDNRVTDLRQMLADARAADDDFKAEALLEELGSLVGLADDNDVDTSQMRHVLAVETGAIPIVEEA